MRENMGLYRGKRKDGKGWVEGCYTKIPRPMIFVSGPMYAGGWEWIDVDPDTVGEATGFSDKNGVKVFEGDILADYSGLYIRAEVVWNEGNLAWGVRTLGNRNYPLCAEFNCEVIGNIHDNHELLEISKNPAK